MLKGSVSVEDIRKGYLLSEIASWNGGSASKKSSLNSNKNGIQKGKRERVGSLRRSLLHKIKLSCVSKLPPLGLQLWKEWGTPLVTALTHQLQW